MTCPDCGGPKSKATRARCQRCDAARRAAPVMVTELGTERQCRSCGEFWPLDAEFFRPTKGHLESMCIACRNEQRQELRRRRRH